MNPVATLLEAASRLPTISLPIGTWLRVAAERRALGRLDRHALLDMGIDPTEARLESERPFWDLPRGR